MKIQVGSGLVCLLCHFITVLRCKAIYGASSTKRLTSLQLKLTCQIHKLALDHAENTDDVERDFVVSFECDSVFHSNAWAWYFSLYCILYL